MTMPTTPLARREVVLPERPKPAKICLALAYIMNMLEVTLSGYIPEERSTILR
jgi:hypothetical protein